MISKCCLTEKENKSSDESTAMCLESPTSNLLEEAFSGLVATRICHTITVLRPVCKADRAGGAVGENVQRPVSLYSSYGSFRLYEHFGQTQEYATALVVDIPTSVKDTSWAFGAYCPLGRRGSWEKLAFWYGVS